MQQVWPVFSIIVLIDYSWMFYRFFFQLPSWLYYMKAGNIVVLLSYTLSFALIESLMVLGLLFFLCLIFPARYFKDRFIPQGSIQVFVITMLAIIIRQRIDEFSKMEAWILIAIPVLVVLILSFSIVIISKMLERFSLITKWVTSLAERTTVFLYLYPPLGVLSFVLVIVRNIY